MRSEDGLDEAGKVSEVGSRNGRGGHRVGCGLFEVLARWWLLGEGIANVEVARLTKICVSKARCKEEEKVQKGGPLGGTVGPAV